MTEIQRFVLNQETFSFLFQGAESKIYKTTFLGYDVVIKERFRKKYRLKEFDERIVKLRTRNEARCINKANERGMRVPRIFFIDTINGIIIMEYIHGDSLCNMLSEGKLDVKDIACKVGKVLHFLHFVVGVIHGDLTSSNIIINNNEAILIDFGLSSQSTNNELRAVDLYSFQRSLKCRHNDLYEELNTNILESYNDGSPEVNKTLNSLKLIQKRGRKRELEN